jgi:hypothetical protein
MAYLAGETITDSVLVVDENGTAVIGSPNSVFTTQTCYGPDNQVRTVTIVAVGGGLYRASFPTNMPGSYALTLVAATPTGNKTFFNDYDVDAAEVSGIAGQPGVAFGANTRAGLRRRVGTLIGEMMSLKLTAAGTTTTAIDTRNLQKQNNSLVGRQVWVASAANAQNVGMTARITANDKSQSTITFTPALSAATAANDVLELWNERDTGATVEDVHEMLNFHIRAVADRTLTTTVQEVTQSFDIDTPVLSLPAGWVTFTGAEWADVAGIWHSIPPADLRVDPTNRTVEVRNLSRVLCAKRKIRVRGATSAAELDSEIATTKVDSEWLVYQTAASLMFAGSHRMLDIGQGERKAQYLQTMADSRRPKTDRAVRGKRLQ